MQPGDEEKTWACTKVLKGVVGYKSKTSLAEVVKQCVI
ncbi:hypothetical protein IMPR6_140078 [Imperialibacter sp. EC-SDR9]|nr:hypothetical protein IMPR6_140078 [Imperialibacter sp. EC-SDR9]